MNNTTPILIKNAKLFCENKMINNGHLLIEQGLISAIFSEQPNLTELPNYVRIVDGTNLNLIPGFIDGHIHGAAGADVMDATEEALDTMANVLPEEGTTSFLATTITHSPENIEKALRNVAVYKSKLGKAEVIGVHLEGPFIEKSKKGAQPVEYILEPTIEQFKEWQNTSGNKIMTITMAPEHDADGSFIKYVSQTGVNVSAGHTGTNFEGIKNAIKHGLSQVTHLCNAMTGIHHRDIGVVGAALRLKEIRAELIADGIHVSKEMMQLIYNNMGSERLLLITDSMRAKCLHAGDYELGGQAVTVTHDRAVLDDGTLAGSILKMYQGAQQMLALDDVSIQHIINMASINPAKQVGIYEKKGSLKVGKDADMLLVDDELNIKYTFCRGHIAYEVK
ncbi:N-acetylglucosamine-6-phosphate deacetylase [Virgibacillus byunsanensis]|uniref:N-acetylglucosamine-6-phosphate deacetylase n=1 Tax=Virgibacillus byunsanensis TaxID=570945 RepID=A0ABW3LNB0_9BACI